MDTKVTIIPRITRVYSAAYASFPTSGLKAEDLAFATDRLVLYRWSGAAWVALTIHSSSGLAANIPAAADLPNGSLYYETDTSILKQVQAGTWTTISEVSVIKALAVTDTLRNSNDTERTNASDTLIKIKEVLLNADLAACRIKFDIKTDFSDVWGQVYKNGIAIGVLQTTGNSSYVTFSEDFSGFVSGDLIQLYAKKTGATNVLVQNFRFYYTMFITSLGGETLTTPLESSDDPTISVTNQDP